MFLHEVPDGATKCGSSIFEVTGSPSAAAARVFVRVATTWFDSQVQNVVKHRLEDDAGLLYEASQMKELQTGYTIDAEPTEVAPGSWQVPFTAYIFDMADHR